MSKSNIAQSHIFNGAELPFNFWNMFKEFHRIIDRHIKDLSNIFLLVVYFQGFRIIALTMADLTWDKYVWKEVHFDLDDSVARAGLTAPTLDVKGEASLLVATDFGFIGLSKEVTNIVKNTCVGSRVGTRCSSNRALVNVNQAIHMFNSRNGLELAWLVRIAIKFLCNSFFQNGIDQS